MRLVKQKPRFRCDFCKFVGTENTTKTHENRCYMNPDRECDACENTGIRSVMGGGLLGAFEQEIICDYCDKMERSVPGNNYGFDRVKLEDLLRS